MLQINIKINNKKALRKSEGFFYITYFFYLANKKSTLLFALAASLRAIPLLDPSDTAVNLLESIPYILTK